jgi:hypothetical protein
VRARVLAASLALIGCREPPADTNTASERGEPTPPEPAEDEPATGGCSRVELEHAPKPTIVDGLSATPIDVLEIVGRFEFDARSKQAHAIASMRFRVGEAGMPIFDLRQRPHTVTLDGEPLDPERIAHHDFGMGRPAGMRVLEVELPACSTHELVVEYPLGLPDAPQAKGPRWSGQPPRLHFDVWMSDLQPGRYLESWLPTTLPYDEFALTIEIDLLGAANEHTLISNAEIEALGEHAWLLEFPPTTRPMSPLIAIAPREELVIGSGVHASAIGQDIEWTLILDASLAAPIDAFSEEIALALDDFSRSTGPYIHPRLTVWLGSPDRSMEYDGALTAEPRALVHELFHSWWGRGRRPERHADGWIDEAWDVYSTGPGAFAVEPFDWARPPVVLGHAHPFTRATPNAAYTAGRRLFAGLAATLGVERLRSAMAEFHAREPGGGMTTDELERFLHCEVEGSTEPPGEVRRAFHRFVHGRADEPVSAPGWCESILP